MKKILFVTISLIASIQAEETKKDWKQITKAYSDSGYVVVEAENQSRDLRLSCQKAETEAPSKLLRELKK